MNAVNRMCAMKMRWESRDLAEGHRLLILNGATRKKPDEDRLHVYKCPHCDGYHVGHRNG